jgi:multimeric flavodoxin WrbA
MKAGRTFSLAKKVLLGCEQAGAQVETVHLWKYRIEFCRHCEMCHKKILQCPVRDNAMMLARKILDADGIIFATPNYINNVTGALKTLFDRHSHFIHCKRLLNKYIAAVVTSGSGYDMPVVRYLKYYAIACGAQFSGAVTSRADAIQSKTEEAVALGKKLASDIRRQRRYPGQIRRIDKGLQYFAGLLRIRKAGWKEEYLYWQDKGWL